MYESVVQLAMSPQHISPDEPGGGIAQILDVEESFDQSRAK